MLLDLGFSKKEKPAPKSAKLRGGLFSISFFEKTDGAEPFLLQNDVAFVHHFADIDERVTHPTERGIDAHAGQASDFFERHVGVMPQNNDFALLDGQLVNQLTDAVVRFAFHNHRIDRFVAVFDDVENIKIARPRRLPDVVAAFVAAVVVNTHIIRNSHRPLDKFALVVVRAFAKRVDDFDKNFLENVLRQRLVADEQVNLGEDSGLMTLEQRLERFFVTFEIQLNQSLVI